MKNCFSTLNSAVDHLLRDAILANNYDQDISNEDFFDKIVPYQTLFPKTLWDNFLQYYIVPDRRSTLNLLPSRKPNNQSKSH